MDRKSLLDGTFPYSAGAVAKCIGRIVSSHNHVNATGFRVAKRLIMTCQHVGKGVSENDVIQFCFFEPQIPETPGSLPELDTFQLRPDIFYYESSKLDFAVVAIAKENENLSLDKVDVISCISMIEEGKLPAGFHVSIFSHAEGKPLKLSLRQEVVAKDPQKKLVLGTRLLTDEILLYKAETEAGSSGAPIFNDQWQLIGIHQGFTNELVQTEGKPPHQVFYANYGTFLKSIIEEMFSKVDEPATEFEGKLQGKEEYLGVPFTSMSKKLKERNCVDLGECPT